MPKRPVAFLILLATLVALANADGFAGKWIGLYVTDAKPKIEDKKRRAFEVQLQQTLEKVKAVLALRPDGTFTYNISTGDPKQRSEVKGIWAADPSHIVLTWLQRNGQKTAGSHTFDIVNKGKNLVYQAPKVDAQSTKSRFVFSRQ